MGSGIPCSDGGFGEERPHALPRAVQPRFNRTMPDAEVSGNLMITPPFGVFEQQDFRVFVRQGAEGLAHFGALLRREEPFSGIGRFDVVFFDSHPFLKSLGELSSPSALTAVKEDLLN